jgi:hypothetical protein
LNAHEALDGPESRQAEPNRYFDGRAKMGGPMKVRRRR